MFADPVAVNGSCTHFVRHVSETPIILDPIAVTDAPCERALRNTERTLPLITTLQSVGQCVHLKDTITVKNIFNNNHYRQTNLENM